MIKTTIRMTIPAAVAAGLFLAGSAFAQEEVQRFTDEECLKSPLCWMLGDRGESMVEMKRAVVQAENPHMGMAMNCYAAHLPPDSTADMKREILAEEDITIHCVSQAPMDSDVK